MFSSLLRAIATLYALFVLLLGLLAAQDSAALGYPIPVVAGTGASAVALCTGVLAIAYRWYPPWMREYWRYVFLLCVADFVCGMAMDTALPDDYSLATDGLSWLASTLSVMALLLPAFYLNYRLAFAGRRPA